MELFIYFVFMDAVSQLILSCIPVFSFPPGRTLASFTVQSLTRAGPTGRLADGQRLALCRPSVPSFLTAGLIYM
jgi:hypothetical protein